MECNKEFYIQNFKFRKCSEFNEKLLHKGTCIYEVIRIQQGIPLFLEDHLNRLFNSADISNYRINESYCDIETLISELIKKNNTTEGKIKLIIRFDSEDGFNEKDILIYFTPHYFPTDEEYKEGVKIGLCKTERLNPNAKILNTEARKKANHIMIEESYFEVLLINNKGFITEGSRSNIFFIQDNKIITPELKDVLNGVTRRNILKICKQNNIELIEKKVHYTEVENMEGAFLTGTSLKVLPIHFIGEKEFKTNQEILKKLMKLYDELIKNTISKLA